MEFSTVFASLALVFVAEVGDKTQILCLTLSSRYPPRQVWWAATCAFAFLNLLAVTLGAVLQHWISPFWLGLGVAALFFAFAWQSWRTSSENEELTVPQAASKIFLSVFGLIFLGELGDKTQLSVAALASAKAPLAVWLGSTLALSASAGLAVLLGARLQRWLPVQTLQKVAAVLFMVFGVLSLWWVWHSH